MSQTTVIKVSLADGQTRDLLVQISTDVPWWIELSEPGDGVKRFEGSDLFEALRSMREDFEQKGARLLCAGARPDVAPSGMSRSMSGGRKAYVIQLGSPGDRANMVDIFDYADPDVVGTVQQQREFFEAWANSLRQRL